MKKLSYFRVKYVNNVSCEQDQKIKLNISKLKCFVIFLFTLYTDNSDFCNISAHYCMVISFGRGII